MLSKFGESPIPAMFQVPKSKLSGEIYEINPYTTWKVDGATPMYWFVMAPYYISHLLGVVSP